MNRAVLFDAVGTLIHPEPSVAEAYAQAGRRFGTSLDVDEARSRFRAAFAAEERLDAADAAGRTDEARERRRWRSIVTGVFPEVAANPEHLDRLFDDLWQHFARPQSWRVCERAVARVRREIESGTNVGVASNFDARLVDVIAAVLPEISADHVFASSLVGYRKPAIGFFRACERRLNLPPTAITLIGDDPANDVRGAEAAGWQADLWQA